MVNIFKSVDKFFTSLTDYLTYNYIFMIFVGLFLLTVVTVIILTSRSYEARLIKAIDKFNLYFIDNPHINEDNLVSFNEKMKSKKVPKQLRKNWQQFVLYREDKASSYMSFENCVSNPIKNSTYTRDVKLMNTLAYIFSACALILNLYYCFETADLAAVLSSCLLAPIIILLLNYIVQIFLNVRHSAIVSDLFQNYQYFEVNIDKATETLPEYVDYEVLFDRNEIKKGIPILYAYLQKRAEEEKRELERARLRNVEHEKFNFDDQGVAASLVLERAMQEAENYIAERKKYNQDIQQINTDITQEDLNYREITKEYNRQMQVSKETFENFKAQLEEASSTIEANYIKKQQQQELDRQRNLERDFDTATERHKKIIESYHAELDTIDNFIAQSRKNLETAMKSEFATYSSKVYDEAKKLVEERQEEKFTKLQSNITDLEEELSSKKEELDNAYQQNIIMGDKLEQAELSIANAQASNKKKDKKDKKEDKSEETIKETSVNQPLNNEKYEEVPAYKPLTYEPAEKLPAYETQNNTVNEESTTEYKPLTSEEEPTGYRPLTYEPSNSVPSYEKDDYNQQSNSSLYENVNNASAEESSKIENNSVGEGLSEEEKTLYDKLKEILGPEDKIKQEDLNLSETDVDSKESEESNLYDKLKEILNQEGLVEEDDDEEGNAGDTVDKTLYEELSDILNPKREEDRVEFEENKYIPQTNKYVSTETIDDSKEEVKVASRRGRPRKVVDANAPQGEKRKPGRPRKVVTEEQPAKRKVGRPRKEEQVKTVKKGPGRPRKVEEKPVNKKGPGRPRKETVVVKEAKRKVGRPKKSAVAVSPVKKGRGRPKKIVATEIDEIDAYLKEIDKAIAEENAKVVETKKELAKEAKIRRKK